MMACEAFYTPSTKPYEAHHSTQYLNSCSFPACLKPSLFRSGRPLSISASTSKHAGFGKKKKKKVEDDPWEFLFQQLEKDLGNDTEESSEKEITEEDVQNFERELDMVVEELANVSNIGTTNELDDMLRAHRIDMIKDDDKRDNDDRDGIEAKKVNENEGANTDDEGEDEDDGEDSEYFSDDDFEEPRKVPLQPWQLRKLAAAAELGRRKVHKRGIPATTEGSSGEGVEKSNENMPDVEDTQGGETQNDPINIMSPETNVGDSIFINVANDKIDYESSSHTTVKDFIKSLQRGLVFHLRSNRFGLHVDIPIKVVDDLIDCEASTNSMNLFAMWMENTLSSQVLDQVHWTDGLWYPYLVSKPKAKSGMLKNYFGEKDLGKTMLTFFPIVDESHWTLFIFFNAHIRRVPGLNNSQSSILYFDSISKGIMTKHFPMLKRALQHFSKFCTHSNVQEELRDPKNLCYIDEVQMPQQPNGYDCGYYAMTIMRMLMDGVLMKKRPRKWMSKDWFLHSDVELLKESLDEWMKKLVISAATKGEPDN